MLQQISLCHALVNDAKLSRVLVDPGLLLNIMPLLALKEVRIPPKHVRTTIEYHSSGVLCPQRWAMFMLI